VAVSAHYKVTPGACGEALFLPLLYKSMSCRAGEALFPPDTHPLCSDLTLALGA